VFRGLTGLIKELTDGLCRRWK